MPSPPLKRELLEGMKRADLQRVCKVRVCPPRALPLTAHACTTQEHGLKANLKTEALIELLLDSPTFVPALFLSHTVQPFSSTPADTPQPPPRRPSRQRIVSTRGAIRATASGSRLQSTGSMIVHSDVDEDDGQRAPQPGSGTPTALQSGPATRTRKAKDAQLRLGVGRPTAAGGQGARAVTKSVSSVKGSRSKSGRTAKPATETIVEEATSPVVVAGSSSPQHNVEPAQSPIAEGSGSRRDPVAATIIDQAGAKALLEEQVRPLQHTVASLQRQLQQQAADHARELVALNEKIMTITNDLRTLRCQVESIQTLKSSVEEMQAELSRLRRIPSTEPAHESLSMSTPVSIPPGSPPRPSNPRSHRPPESTTRPSRASRSSPAFEYPPPPAGSPTKPPSREMPPQPSTLGKRHRSPDTVNNAVQADGTPETELRRVGFRSSRKRTKTEQPTEHPSEAPLAGPSNSDLHGDAGVEAPIDLMSSKSVTPGLTSSLALAGPEQPLGIGRTVGDEIFTEQDFDFFDNPPNLQLQADSQPSSSQAEEVRHPFAFTFPGVAQFPVTSTPAPTGALPAAPCSPALGAFPYPERPHSPSPVPMPHRTSGRSQGDVYRPFGFPPGSRNPSSTSTTNEAAIDPIALLHTPPPTFPDMLGLDVDPIDGRRKASSNEIGAGLGMTSMPMHAEDTPPVPVRRTMYGTELEGDTRFGDFGVEGVATGFWTGGRF
ncbi:hypothetical protein BC834DRAFT_848953 [Gloeopeniophorella convolvens]|nr:hypothetical protein BC834DRAFT_848953 [Gloeopeniophorella convolvens]